MDIVLEKISQVIITVTDETGKSKTSILPKDELIRRVKSSMYQTITHAVGSEAKHLINDAVCENVLVGGVFDVVRKFRVEPNKYEFIHKSHDTVQKEFPFYFWYKDLRWYYKTKEECGTTLELMSILFNYIKNKPCQKKPKSSKQLQKK